MASKQIIGGRDNFWLYSKDSGFDLTHPETPKAPEIYPRICLRTSRQPISIDPYKTALVVIDTQNYFLSPALGRPAHSVGLSMVEKLVETAVPACRKAGIRLVWLKYGLSDDDIERMPPMMVATTGNDSNFARKEGGGAYGADLGKVLVNGKSVHAGRALVRDQWNTELYPSLEKLRLPEDILLDKNRLSGFWEGLNNSQVLRERGIRTLIFAGANLDQCVASSLLDAFHEGFDIILLSDGAATTSPKFATDCIQWNCELGWGFLISCEELQRGVDHM